MRGCGRRTEAPRFAAVAARLSAVDVAYGSKLSGLTPVVRRRTAARTHALVVVALALAVGRVDESVICAELAVDGDRFVSAADLHGRPADWLVPVQPLHEAAAQPLLVRPHGRRERPLTDILLQLFGESRRGSSRVRGGAAEALRSLRRAPHAAVLFTLNFTLSVALELTLSTAAIWLVTRARGSPIACVATVRAGPGERSGQLASAPLPRKQRRARGKSGGSKP